MLTNVTAIALYLSAMKLISESSVATAVKAAGDARLRDHLALVSCRWPSPPPNAAGRMLSATGAWLGSHRRTLTLVICCGLGAYLVVHGLARVL